MFDFFGRKDKINTTKIVDEIDQYVLPAYEVLNSREAILAHRKNYPLLDNLSSQIKKDSV